jgi:hypothetical protein
MIKRNFVFESDMLMNKKVISCDFKEIGKIESVDDGLFTILRGEDSHYIIPKSRAREIIGDDLLVDFRLNDLLLVELASLSYIE